MIVCPSFKDFLFKGPRFRRMFMYFILWFYIRSVFSSRLNVEGE